MSLKPKPKIKTKRKKVPKELGYFTAIKRKVDTKKSSMKKQINSEYKGFIDVSKIEVIKGMHGNPRVRVIADIHPEFDTFDADSVIYARVESNIGKINAVWEPGIVDEGWEFNYILRKRQ